MKKYVLLFLSLVILLSLCACGGGSDAPKTKDELSDAPKTKDELLAVAKPLKMDTAERAFDNLASAKELVGNTYTFYGEVYSIETDYVDVELTHVPDSEGTLHSYGYSNLSAHVYLSREELETVSFGSTISIVATITDAETKKTKDPFYDIDIIGNVLVMKEAYLND